MPTTASDSIPKTKRGKATVQSHLWLTDPAKIDLSAPFVVVARLPLHNLANGELVFSKAYCVPWLLQAVDFRGYAFFYQLMLPQSPTA